MTHARQSDAGDGRVFARAWHCLPPATAPAAADSALPFTLLPGCLDEPLVATRGAGGVERVLSNACTHRGALVATSACAGRELRCPYHGRRFGLDGRCRGAPGFEQDADFTREQDHQPAAPTHRRGALRFVALEPALAFDDWAQALDGRLGFLPFATMRHEPAGEREFEIAADWTLYVENYLEGFHVPFVHPSLARTLDLSRYHYEAVPHGHMQLAEARADEPAIAPPAGHPDAGRRLAAYYLWLWPNLMLNAYPWGLSVNAVEPCGTDRTRVRYHRFTWAEQHLGTGAGADLDQVELEDQAVVESVQRGMRARLWRGAALHPRHEDGVRAFQRMLAAARA
jgi:choline monooxygenase